MMTNKMISRRQIIRAGHSQADQKPMAANSSGSSAASSGCSSSSKSHSSSRGGGSSGQLNEVSSTMIKSATPSTRHQQQQQQQQQQIRSASRLGSQASSQKMIQNGRPAKKPSNDNLQQQQQDSSDGYVAASSLTNQYEDYASWAQSRNPIASSGRNGPNSSQQLPTNYRSFDPYSVYSEEEDVWYSEERLFEDHLDEIYNKWPLLDDDIWCKLIIMERNRRIGKAYARVPIVTIDGSHELSYDGYKLALNGFDNPDRDLETEQCRKRIGKGIRIKMDNFGNILIKRLSKSGVYVKEYLNPLLSSNSASEHHLNSTISHFNGKNTSGDDINGGRIMPSRQQLIKNQNALLAASASGKLGRTSNGSTPATVSSSSSGGSSMEPSNDSAICDEIIDLGGRLDLDKIYILFDMKKFQANITQELCRRYPDRHKLEQQCFSIVGLSRDNDDILSLPCWVMVINIVAIEMLNERFPLEQQPHELDYIPNDLMHLQESGHREHPVPPSFVNIFDQQQQQQQKQHSTAANRRNLDPNKEEDPYSLPANASSSDVRSSINDYGTTGPQSNRNLTGGNAPGHQRALPSRYYNGSKAYSRRGEQMQSASRQPGEAMMSARHRSKSNYEIYGQHGQPAARSNHTSRHPTERYSNHNNSSSIYSPGHMLVQPQANPNDPMPPKLPPRDFVKKAKSRSSVDVCDASCMMLGNDKSSENIYSTGAETADRDDQLQSHENETTAKVTQRKSKKNRFLESLKAPLDQLAKSSTNRSASVLDSPINGGSSSKQQQPQLSEQKSGSDKNKKRGGLKSFLGVGKSTKSSADHAADGEKSKHSKGELGPNEEVADHQQQLQSNGNQLSSSQTLNYNDLDIPTPDYETDENIYAIEESGRQYSSNGNGNKSRRNSLSQKDLLNGKLGLMQHNNSGKQSGRTTKDDLYYSGFLAHVPKNSIGATRNEQRLQQRSGKLAPNCDDRMSCMENSRLSSKRSTTSHTAGRDLIYGSTIGLQARQPATTGSRYRSASMQRVYPRSGQILGTLAMSHRSQEEIYDLESTENPYAMSGQCDLEHLHDPYGPANCDVGGLSAVCRSVAPKGRLNDHKLYSTNGRLQSNASATILNSADYDIGRSSSGIYGVNSGSSSSDYADCMYPKLRKVNSSGYLNSIFKNRQKKLANPTGAMLAQQQQQVSLMNNNNSKMGDSDLIAGHEEANSADKNRNKPARTFKSMIGMNNKQQQQQTRNNQHNPTNQQQQQQQVAGHLAANSNYRSYDSSNDSEPSYTNSSDGLDIYDQIGANSRMVRNQLLNSHHLAPEVHVGEWENMYDR